jgi:hypothetical protein
MISKRSVKCFVGGSMVKKIQISQQFNKKVKEIYSTFDFRTILYILFYNGKNFPKHFIL